MLRVLLVPVLLGGLLLAGCGPDVDPYDSEMGKTLSELRLECLYECEVAATGNFQACRVGGPSHEACLPAYNTLLGRCTRLWCEATDLPTSEPGPAVVEFDWSDLAEQMAGELKAPSWHTPPLKACEKGCAVEAGLDFHECSTSSNPMAICEEDPEFAACTGSSTPDQLCLEVFRASQEQCIGDKCGP